MCFASPQGRALCERCGVPRALSRALMLEGSSRGWPTAGSTGSGLHSDSLCQPRQASAGPVHIQLGCPAHDPTFHPGHTGCRPAASPAQDGALATLTRQGQLCPSPAPHPWLPSRPRRRWAGQIPRADLSSSSAEIKFLTSMASSTLGTEELTS